MQTLFTGRELIELEEVDSTNNYALRLLHDRPVREGTAVLARVQTAGKGQRGNSWLSRPGENLTFSLVFHPVFLQAGRQFMLNKIASLAVRDFAQDTLKQPVHIKWPNDIYAGDRKIAGILIESIYRGSGILSSVIGIGMNINQVEFPSSLPNPVSFRMLTGASYDLSALFSGFCTYMEARYLQLRTGRHEAIDSDYLAGLHRFDQWAQFHDGKGEFRGRICGVSPAGKLIVEREGGQTNEFDFKEIAFTGSSSP
ncbi:MAG: biotin--[acetyl-CoA-carboxylase] ligase [Bacteroidota bacterium]